MLVTYTYRVRNLMMSYRIGSLPHGGYTWEAAGNGGVEKTKEEAEEKARTWLREGISSLPSSDKREDNF